MATRCEAIWFCRSRRTAGLAAPAVLLGWLALLCRLLISCSSLSSREPLDAIADVLDAIDDLLAVTSSEMLATALSADDRRTPCEATSEATPCTALRSDSMSDFVMASELLTFWLTTSSSLLITSAAW